MARGSARILVLAALLLAVLVPTASGGPASARHRSPFAGLGTWVDIYSTKWADPEGAVAAMAQRRVQTLYLETGNYSHAAPVYRPDRAGRFIDAAHAAGIQVVAWYLPAFLNVKTDAAKSLAAIRFRSATGERFDGFALDIEATTVRALPLRNRRLVFLSAKLHHAVPRRYPLGAITPSPVGMSPSYWPNIPYGSLTHFYKAFLPMAYSTMRRIHGRAATLRYLASTVSTIRAASGRPAFPIHLIGGISGAMGTEATAGFVKAVDENKVFGYSLYDFDQTTSAAWQALARHS